MESATLPVQERGDDTHELVRSESERLGVVARLDVNVDWGLLPPSELQPDTLVKNETHCRRRERIGRRRQSERGGARRPRRGRAPVRTHARHRQGRGRLPRVLLTLDFAPSPPPAPTSTALALLLRVRVRVASVVLRVIDERLAVHGERGEDGRRVVPGEEPPAVLDDEVRVVRQVVVRHELPERDLALQERLVVSGLVRFSTVSVLSGSVRRREGGTHRIVPKVFRPAETELKDVQPASDAERELALARLGLEDAVVRTGLVLDLGEALEARERERTDGGGGSRAPRRSGSGLADVLGRRGGRGGARRVVLGRVGRVEEPSERLGVRALEQALGESDHLRFGLCKSIRGN